MMGFIGEVQLGFVVRIEGEFVVAWRRGGAFCKGIVITRSPRGPSFCSCKRKQNRAKGNQAFPFANPFDAKLRLDTDDALASSVRHRRYALKVPAAHFILDFAGTELKINLISVAASDATFA